MEVWETCNVARTAHCRSMVDHIANVRALDERTFVAVSEHAERDTEDILETAYTNRRNPGL